MPTENGTEDFLSGGHGLGSNGTPKNDPTRCILAALWRVVDLNTVWLYRAVTFRFNDSKQLLLKLVSDMLLQSCVPLVTTSF